jgi:hypothetical protein
MTGYRRNFMAGGSFFFTVNALCGKCRHRLCFDQPHHAAAAGTCP